MSFPHKYNRLFTNSAHQSFNGYFEKIKLNIYRMIRRYEGRLLKLTEVRKAGGQANYAKNSPPLLVKERGRGEVSVPPP